MHAHKRWIYRLGCLIVLLSCMRAPLQADCDCCDGCGDAYRRSRICQVAGGWVIGGIIVAAIAVAIFGKGCDHHHCHRGKNNHHQRSDCGQCKCVK